MTKSSCCTGMGKSLRKSLVSLSVLASVTLVANAAETTVPSLDNPNGPVDVAAGDTLIVTGPVVSTGDTNSTRFDKTGDGTLVLKGSSNSFKRLKQSGGSLVFSGGASAVSGGSGAGFGNDANVVFEGAETIVTGGGSLMLGTDPYAKVKSKSTVITNGLLDASGITSELLCNSNDSGTPTNLGQGIVTIGQGGRMRVKSMRPHQNAGASYKDKFGFSLVDGGTLEVTGKDGIKLDGAQYGFVHFDGGVLANSCATGDSSLPGVVNGTKGSVAVQWANSPITIGERGAIVSNATANALNLVLPFKSGAEKDGGLHLAGKYFLFIKADGSTYNGGLYLDSNEGLLVAPEYDGSLGAVPATPTDSIFARGTANVFFGRTDLDVHANRNFLISSNRTLNVIANAGKTLTIHGEVNGARDPGQTPKTTRMNVTYKNSAPATGTWKGGRVVLDPGVGRTNDVGRLNVEGVLEIKSGTTRVTSPLDGIDDSAPVRVLGNNAIDSQLATLIVSGGELVTSADSVSKYFHVNLGGVVDVCGGKIDTAGGDYLNAMSAGRTIVRNGGVIDCGTFRIAQYMTTNPTVLRLETNGLIRANNLFIDTSKSTTATVLFDGGAVQSKSGGNPFVASYGNAAWDRITFAVGPGGAVLDTSNSKNLWWHRPLVSGVEAGQADGGLISRGAAGLAVVLMVPQHYTGPTTVDGNTLQQRGGDNLLPTGTELVLKNRGEAHFTNYDKSSAPNAATLGGVKGDGVLRGCAKVTVNGAIAPSVGGTIEFDNVCTLSGTLLVDGDASGCGKVKFDKKQDVSGLTLKIADVSKLNGDAERTFYEIVEAPNGLAGKFRLAADFPAEWSIGYSADGKHVYMRPHRGLSIVIR